MKPLLLLCVLISCASLRAQPVDLAKLTGPDGLVRDADYGVAFVLPAGWKLEQGHRWGEFESTLYFSIAGHEADFSAAVYYQSYSTAFAPAEGFDAWLRHEAQRKQEMRVRDGRTNYANRADSATLRTINDTAALSWFADFAEGKARQCELFTHIVNATGHLQYFITVPAEKLAEIAPAYEALIKSTRLTAGPVAQNLNRDLRAAREAYQAGNFAAAVASYIEAFRSGPVRTSDYLKAAGTAARAGNPPQAISWLQSALNQGGFDPQKLAENPDFAELRGTPEWKRLNAVLTARLARKPSAITDQPLHDQLATILDEDQKYRKQLDEVEKKFGRNSPEIRELWKTIAEKDDVNLVAVKKILDERGWLGPDVVGSDGNSALFLVIQHADLATQQKYLPMMRIAAKQGDAQPSSLALLEDRVALRTGQKQIYGSQIGRDQATGKYFVDALDDPEHVDDRRASVGLGSLAEYVKHWNIAWDPAAYRQEQEQRAAAKANAGK